MSNPWADNPAAITPRELLLLAVEALDNWPDVGPANEYDQNKQHPEDAHSTAFVVLNTVTAARSAEWQRNRPTATAT